MLIALTGYSRVGKDSFADGFVQQHGFVKVGFAGALKELAASINPWIEGKFHEGPPHAKLSYWEQYGNEDWLKDQTDYREFLKALGNGVRAIDEGFWVRTAMERASSILNEEGDVIITDCRFPNEAAAVRDEGGFIVRVVRDGYGPESDFERYVDEIAVDAVVGGPDVAALHALVGPTLGVLARVSR